MNHQENELDPGGGDCAALLEEVLTVWPKPDHSEPADFRRRLAPRLSEEFDDTDLLNRVASVRAWGKSKTGPDETNVDFSDTDGSLQRAVFVNDRRRGWLLKSLKFQCPVCFGLGKNDGETCTICGGLGWGAS